MHSASGKCQFYPRCAGDGTGMGWGWGALTKRNPARTGFCRSCFVRGHEDCAVQRAVRPSCFVRGHEDCAVQRAVWPHADLFAANPGPDVHRGAGSWSVNYFFYNKKLKKLAFFACWVRSKSRSRSMEGADDGDQFEMDSDGDMDFDMDAQ
eukprot:2638370-Rhodomonas_salina.4